MTKASIPAVAPTAVPSRALSSGALPALVAAALLFAAACSSSTDIAKLPGLADVKPTGAMGRRCYERCASQEAGCRHMCPGASADCADECVLDTKACLVDCPELERRGAAPPH